ncbi:MAG: M20/M25/M40 family metallo-hydrolase [Acidobacteriia bacterium]|nr:M20/M25/M40 family metallo-hydrolase [Terriglobia bacterium]
MRKIPWRLVCLFFPLLLLPARAGAQSPEALLGELEATPAVAGYEQQLAAELREELKGFSPRTDNLGNVYVTLGSGAPHRLIVTAVDEPGYVVSAITPDGFLRVQRLPQAAPHAVFDLLHAAQPVWVMTRGGKKIAGVFAGLSVHLQPARQNAPKMAHPDEMYVDIGAGSAEEARAAGVDVLDAVALQRSAFSVGASSLAGPALGDRAGAAALMALLENLDRSRIRGTLTVAFVTQQWTGGRGLDRLLNEIHPDEMIYVGRLFPPKSNAAAGAAVPPGSGALLGVPDAAAALAEFPAAIKKLAEASHIPMQTVMAAPPRIAGYAKASALPARFAQVFVPTLGAITPGEVVNSADLAQLANLLTLYAGAAQPHSPGIPDHAGPEASVDAPLAALVRAYGASGHEGMVRDTVRRLLPKWAKPETDAAGNLILHLGGAKPGAKTPRIVFAAHMDEIGYQVRVIEPDGRLLVDVLGGGFTEYFLGHAVLVHKADGSSVGGVLELPGGWDQPGFEWPRGMKAMDEASHVYVGTKSAEETRKLGIQAGDWVTILKEYRALLGTRANGRSFDDRVGCAALVEAVRALGPEPELAGRDVTFIWSTEEEVGLKGAAAAAERMAKEGQAADFVFAIDTFVSADSPLESKRFADAETGKGFVVRAVDNSNIVPREYVERVLALARENRIPAQYGVTGGGNDGAVFTRYGAVDIALGWPLRYSHSPAEVIDTRDADALARIIAVLAKSW